MGLREAYQSMIRAFPGGSDAIAAALGMTPAALQNRLYEVKGQTIQIEHALAMQALTNTTHFAEAIAKLSGGVFVQIPMPEDCADAEVVDLMAKSLATHGDVGAEIVKTLADGRVEPHEAKKVNDRAFAHITTVVSLAGRIEGMSEK